MAYVSTMQDETIRKGPWLEEEDEQLAIYIGLMGERRWDSIAKASGMVQKTTSLKTGLSRKFSVGVLGTLLKCCNLLCRSREEWKELQTEMVNYLRPDLKHGQINAEEECIIIQLQERWGNKWSKIARRLPGRTDNEIKNYWRTHLRRKAQAQEQEKLHKEIEKVMGVSKKMLVEEGDLSIPSNSTESGGSDKEDILSKTEHSVDVINSPDYAFAFSPYDARLCDWVSESLQNQHQGKCDMLWDYHTGFLWG